MALPPWLRRLLLGPSDPPVQITWARKPPSNRPGSSSLAGLLDALEDIGSRHTELFDTDVRERVWAVVERRYVRGDTSMPVPLDLGLFSPEANLALKAALEHHLQNLQGIAATFGLDSEAKRLEALQNPDVRSHVHGYTFEDFFGAP